MSTMTGKEMRELRKAKGLTQFKLALLMGVTPPTIYRWETGRAAISEQVSRHLHLALETVRPEQEG